VIVIAPLYFMFDAIGKAYPPPINHPDLYYGFAGVTLSWQIAFLIIAKDPIRLRPLIPAAVLEKALYVGALLVLYGQGRITPMQAGFAIPDGLLGVLFAISYIKTKASLQTASRATQLTSR
jgi:hypothetical protein